MMAAIWKGRDPYGLKEGPMSKRMSECDHKYSGYFAELAYEESPPEVKENPPMVYICEHCKEVLNWKGVVQMLNEHPALIAEVAGMRDKWTPPDEVAELQVENETYKRALRYLATITGHWCIYPDGDREHVSAGVVRHVATNALSGVSDE